MDVPDHSGSRVLEQPLIAKGGNHRLSRSSQGQQFPRHEERGGWLVKRSGEVRLIAEDVFQLALTNYPVAHRFRLQCSAHPVGWRPVREAGQSRAKLDNPSKYRSKDRRLVPQLGAPDALPNQVAAVCHSLSFSFQFHPSTNNAGARCGGAQSVCSSRSSISQSMRRSRMSSGSSPSSSSRHVPQQ